MIRRWKLGLALVLIVGIIASGGFASTASIDVPPSNAGVVTIPVQFSAAEPTCDGAEGGGQPSGIDDGTSTGDQNCEQDDADDNILAPFLDALPD